jgi:hypothetical protein
MNAIFSMIANNYFEGLCSISRNIIQVHHFRDKNRELGEQFLAVLCLCRDPRDVVAVGNPEPCLIVPCRLDSKSLWHVSIQARQSPCILSSMRAFPMGTCVVPRIDRAGPARYTFYPMDNAPKQKAPVLVLLDTEIVRLERDLASLRRTREILAARTAMDPFTHGALDTTDYLARDLNFHRGIGIVEGSLGHTILETLREAKRPLSPKELLKAVNVKNKFPTAKNIAATLSRYVQSGKIKRLGVGRYVLPTENPTTVELR